MLKEHERHSRRQIGEESIVAAGFTCFGCYWSMLRPDRWFNDWANKRFYRRASWDIHRIVGTKTMIGITTENGTLHIYGEILIPNSEAGQWSPARIKQLAEIIEAYVFAGELVDKETCKLVGCVTFPLRKANFKSGLVIDA